MAAKYGGKYHASLTQPTKFNERNVCPCANDIVYARFEDLRTFLYVFMSVVEVFARLELRGNVPVAIHFFTYGGLWFCITCISNFKSL